MKTFLSQFLRSTYLVLSFWSLTHSRMALADTPSLADLPEITMSEANFSVKAPAGWRVRQHYRGKTLVFEDPMISRAYGREYSRNITVAIQREVRPIDAMEIQRLNAKLTKEFGRGLKDFEIIESRIINYRASGDAILVFSTFTQSGVPMRQMHIFTSGSDNSVLMSYTDLEQAFEAEGAMDRVWPSMMSAELSGHAPKRYDGFVYSMSGLVFMGSAAFLSKTLRRRQSKSQLRKEEDHLFEDDDDREVYRRPATAAWQMAETRIA